ncbi:tRNA1(Val) (adenine(37)-N6)-methyltransferase [Sediminibacterium soli]|uniref:tRNA1(Val) (adenine(37)-N6)-methyltransferase n=1 Tax=Sediminibacterium soli TaxID=2698829 RepID=UPI00293BB9B2|nr:methyltransferase [Sediminibacterium soli]NCI46154.1 methyltransferase [Sediminibacterium soli]
MSFQFKQFTIHQERCAMKVCTDACLFGAWLADMAAAEHTGGRVLDIGTGTGLLSLLLAQQHGAMIDAVEIDPEAAVQAAENFGASPWKERLQLVNGDIRSWQPGERYDLIISNPPFFANDLKSADAKRNLALHGAALGLDELFRIARELVSDRGAIALLLPYHRKEESMRLAGQQGLTASWVVDVRQTEKHGFFRTMLWFVPYAVTTQTDAITIKEENAYSERFVSLLKAYYLYL